MNLLSIEFCIKSNKFCNKYIECFQFKINYFNDFSRDFRNLIFSRELEFSSQYLIWILCLGIASIEHFRFFIYLKYTLFKMWTQIICISKSIFFAKFFLAIIYRTILPFKKDWRWMFDAILFYFGTGRYIFQNERFWFCCQHKFQINREFKGNLFNKNIVRKRMNYKIFINHMEMKYLKLLKLKTSK